MTRRYAVALVAIIVVAAALRLVCFRGYVGDDDIAYTELAWRMANGQFSIGGYVGPPVYPLRIGIVAPVALGFRMAGLREAVLVAYPFILSMANLLLAFVAGRMLFGARAGVMAAAFLAVLPIDVRLASMLMPDLPAAFWAGVGMLILYWASRPQTASRQGARPPLLLLGACSGAAFGASWLCKESVVYSVPFVAGYLVYLVWRDRRYRSLLAGVALASLAVLAVETWVYYRHTGDLLYRMHETERNYQMTSTWFFMEGSRLGWQKGGYGMALIARILRDGPVDTFVDADLGFVTAAAALATAYAALRRLRPFLFPGLWFLSLVFMFDCGSSSLSSYRPLTPAGPYLYPLFLPAVALTAGFIDMLFGNAPPGANGSSQSELARERRFWGVVMAAGVALTCATGLYRNVRLGIGSPVERSIASVISPQDRVYTDSRTAVVLNFFWHYPASALTSDFEHLRADQVSPDSYVLINRNRVETLNAFYGYAPPEFYASPPHDWEMRWQGVRAELYRTSSARSASMP